MRLHVLVSLIERLHFVDVIRHAREFPESAGEQVDAALAEASLVVNSAFMTVDRRHGLEIPKLIVDKPRGIVVIAPDAQLAMSTDEFAC